MNHKRNEEINARNGKNISNYKRLNECTFFSFTISLNDIKLYRASVF